MLKQSILNTAVQVAGKVVTVIISLVTTGILTRRLGVGVYGSYTLVNSVFVLLDSAADFGTKIIGVREAAGKEGEERKKIYIQTAYLRLVTTGVAYLLGLGLIRFWSGFEGIRLEAIVALSMMWLTSVAGSMEIIFQTKLRMDLKVLLDIMFPFLFLLALLQQNEVSLRWVFGTYLLTRLISLILGFGLIKRIEMGLLLVKFDREMIKKILKESWPMGVYLIVFASYDRAVDSMMIERFRGITEVAFYGLAYKIYSNLIQPAYYFVNSVFPFLSSKNEGKRKLFSHSALIIGAGVISLIPLAYVLAPWAIEILAGSGYEASVGVLRILLIALFFSYISHLVGFTLISKGGQKDILGLGLAALVFNISANFYAIPRFGISGAAIVTGLTEALACGLMIWRLWRTVKSRKV